MSAPVTILIDVEKAAPMIPHPKGKTNSQSRMTLIMADIRLHIMASLGEPSNRIINKDTVIHI